MYQQYIFWEFAKFDHGNRLDGARWSRLLTVARTPRFRWPDYILSEAGDALIALGSRLKARGSGRARRPAAAAG